MSNQNQDGRPVVWRHNTSGVWIGRISESKIPGHIKLYGRRIRVWSGGRIDVSSIAVKGCTAEDTLTEVVDTDIALEGSVEITSTTNELVEAALALPSATVA